MFVFILFLENRNGCQEWNLLDIGRRLGAAFPDPTVNPKHSRRRTLVLIEQIKIQNLRRAATGGIRIIINGSHGLEKKPTPATFEGRSDNITCRHSPLRWKPQTMCGDVVEMTGLGAPGV
jgi:hypothetical protein